MSNDVFWFGKYKGLPLSQIPDSYLEWILENFMDGEALHMAGNELYSREGWGMDKVTAPSMSDFLLRFGKYKGQNASDLDDATLLNVLGAWNGSSRICATKDCKRLNEYAKSRGLSVTS